MYIYETRAFQELHHKKLTYIKIKLENNIFLSYQSAYPE